MHEQTPSSAVATRVPGGIFPKVVFVHGAERREMSLSLMPFTIGRKTGKDLEIPDPRVSRDHAEIVCEDGSFYIIDATSKLGTYVNKERVSGKRKLLRNDRVEFGVGVGAQLIFDPVSDESSVAREFLSQISMKSVATEKTNDLEKLALFLEAARKLNSAGALEEVMVSLIDTTLKLTGAERGFVYLRQPDGIMKMEAACTASGERVASDETISHSILQDAANSASEFIVTDTSKMSGMEARQSIIAHDLRMVLAIPLRKAQRQTGAEELVLGVLYLDSRFASGSISGVGHDILGVIAREAAALVESTNLAKMEEEGRRVQQELNIAASIQQRLMSVKIPEVNYATLSAKNIPCRDIGGDFFDVLANDKGLFMVVTDVSGKGVSAAILASILQGMIYAQLTAGVHLAEIATSVNSFLCQRVQGEKYATLTIVHVHPDGKVEYVNCGHVPPVAIQQKAIARLQSGCLPVGLLSEAEYHMATMQLSPGDRLVLVTDGVTEAEDATGDLFGDERLEQAALLGEGSSFDVIFACVREFCGDIPLNDDCTMMEVIYMGGSSPRTKSDSALKLA